MIGGNGKERRKEKSVREGSIEIELRKKGRRSKGRKREEKMKELRFEDKVEMNKEKILRKMVESIEKRK